MNDQAKLLLSAYRPGGADATDPAFAEALVQAQRDPQLRAWLEESQRFDEAIAGRLRSVAVPENLRATILAGAKFSRPRSGWQSARLWAMAALVAVFASVAARWFGKDTRLESWQSNSLAVLDQIESGSIAFDTTNPQPSHLVDWLRANAAPVPAAMPPVLATHPTFGCKAIDSNGRRVSLICFNLGNGDQAHLFTTPRAGLKFPPPEKHPIFARKNHWNLASWRSGGEVHMLATEMDETRLRALLPEAFAVRGMASPAVIAEILAAP